MLTRNKRLTGILIGTASLLLIPLIAMQFTKEVNWKLGDFAVAAILLMGTGLVCEAVIRKVRKSGYRIVLIASVLIVLALIWIELAVGIFGTPFAGN
jgi:hypothetical protein